MSPTTTPMHRIATIALLCLLAALVAVLCVSVALAQPAARYVWRDGWRVEAEAAYVVVDGRPLRSGARVEALPLTVWLWGEGEPVAARAPYTVWLASVGRGQ